MITIPIPLPGGDRWVTITMPRPITEDDWTHLQNVITVMKPGLVAAPDQPGDQEGTSP